MTNKIYDKLFWGCNIPALTPRGKKYIPLWSAREISIINKVLTEGVRIFRDSVINADAHLTSSSPQNERDSQFDHDLLRKQ